MWCIDKITKIDLNGEGRILGGKPIQLKDIHGASERTNSRNLNKLEKLGYIRLIHTPRGISIRVMKAKKHFQSKESRVDKSGVPVDSGKTEVSTQSTKFGVPNKIRQHDKTINTLSNESEAKNKTMKNSFKYNEGKHSDEFEDSIDLDTGEFPKKKKPVLKTFSLEEKLQEMEKEENSHSDIIATFVREKGLVLLNQKQLDMVKYRYTATAKRMSGAYTNKEIYKAYDYAKKNYKDIDWTLETLIKILTK